MKKYIYNSIIILVLIILLSLTAYVLYINLISPQNQCRLAVQDAFIIANEFCKENNIICIGEPRTSYQKAPRTARLTRIRLDFGTFRSKYNSGDTQVEIACDSKTVVKFARRLEEHDNVKNISEENALDIFKRQASQLEILKCTTNYRISYDKDHNSFLIQFDLINLNNESKSNEGYLSVSGATGEPTSYLLLNNQTCNK